MTDYAVPPWDAPLDTESFIRAIPESAVIKGMYPGAVAAEARKRGFTLPHAGERYLPFFDYPLTNHMRLMAEAASAFFPDVSTRQGLRRLGRGTTANFMESTFGKAVLGGLMQPDSVGRALSALVRAYATSLGKPTPQVEVIETGPTSAELKFRDTWVFLDSQQVGILEGVCHACGVRGKVSVAVAGPSEAAFLCTWEIGHDSKPPSWV